MKEYLKSLLIRTSLEKPAKKIQSFLESIERNKYPELQEIGKESQRIEQLFQHIINRSSNCIDIGCHLGSTLSEIVKLSPQGSHIAFEPTPYKAEWLKRKFPEVEIKVIALSERCDEEIFYLNKSHSGFSGLLPHKSGQNNNFEKITVQCDKLDNILTPDYRVDFIKLDVEGAELKVLNGAVNTLNSYHPVILFECTNSGLSLFGFSCAQMFEFFTKELSYSIFLLKDFLADEKALTFEEFLTATQYPFQAFNFVAAYSQPI